MTGKVAIITGSGSGIGAASAVLLAKNGWNIVINYASRIDSAKDVAQACAAHGAETLLCKANVAEDADCRRMAADAMTRWGRIDALVNSAGTTRFADHADLEALSGDDFLEVYRINVVGPWQMVRAVVPHMKAGGKGAIVNISSGAAIGPGRGPYRDAAAGARGGTCYGAEKAALERFTQGLAAEVYQYGISVTCVSPSQIVPTPGTVYHRLVKSIDDPRGEPPQLMAKAALLLATEPLDRVTGRVTYSQQILKEFGWISDARGRGVETRGSGYAEA